MRLKIDALTLTVLGKFIAQGSVEPLTYTKEQKEIIILANKPMSHGEKIAYERAWNKRKEEAKARQEREKKRAELARRIRHLRAQSGYTQKKMGDYIGVRREIYSQYERNITPIKEEYLPLIAEALGVTVEELLKEE